MKRWLFIVYVILCAQLVRAQSTEGTEFWMTFMNNWNAPVGDEGLVLKLIASSRQNVTITVANPQTGYSNTFDVKANSIAEFIVPHEQGYTNDILSKSRRGLRITATAPISLFASNFHEHTYDATIVLPVTALGTDYIAQMYESIDLVAIDIYAPDNKQAKLIKKNFHKNPEILYKVIMATVTNDKDLVKDCLEDMKYFKK